MRSRILVVGLAVAGLFRLGAAVFSQAPPPDAQAVAAAARTALGGDARIAAVKTFTITGRTRQVQGNNLVPIEFEIQAELPDKYVRRDEIPVRESGLTTVGFSGNALIQAPASPPGPPRGGGPPPTPAQLEAAAQARVTGLKQDFARLMLGMFASTSAGFPVTFAYAAQAEAPQGRADVLTVSGPDGFTSRLFVHTQTHLPIMVSWEEKGVEQRLYFADHRQADGLQLPFRIRRATGADTTEETTIDRVRINARIDARRFQPGN